MARILIGNLLALAALLAAGCAGQARHGEGKMSVKKGLFSKTADGQSVYVYELTNNKGLKAKVINYGAILTELHVPDRDGKQADIVLGYTALKDYVGDGWKMGATVGRCANRISNASFTIDNVEHKITANLDNRHHIHGGKKGFSDQLWDAQPIESDSGVGVRMKYLSKDGEEGYPGNLNVTVTYMLTAANELMIDYVATTDKPTVVNLTNHSYFNLCGHNDGDVLGHELMINADKYTVSDERRLPTGEIKAVKDSPLDFTKTETIGARIKEAGGFYDNNYCINGADGSLRLAAKVYEPKTGRAMEVLATQPGVQLFTPNYTTALKGKGGTAYKGYAAFCLETQHYPDAANKPNFPSTVLRPGQRYAHTAVFRFSTK